MSTVDFVDGAWDVAVLDEGFVSCIVENDGVVCLGVVDPSLELFAGGRSTCWVVRVAEVDDVYFFCWDGWDEVILRGARKIDEAFVTSTVVGIPSVADHDVGVDIDWVNGVGDGDGVAVAENVEDVACVALGTIGDEDVIGADVEASIAVLYHRFSQECVALLWTVATEGVAVAEFVDGFVHCFADGEREWLGDVADATFDEVLCLVRVRLSVGRDAATDFWEKVASFELEKVIVDVCHVGRIITKTEVDARNFHRFRRCHGEGEDGRMKACRVVRARYCG